MGTPAIQINSGLDLSATITIIAETIVIHQDLQLALFEDILLITFCNIPK